jgi:phosphoribosylglycinamide formyltransferase-1
MVNIALFASGNGTNAERLINYFSDSKQVKIKLVITNNENAGIVEKAIFYKKNLQLISKATLTEYTDQFIDFLKTEEVDLIILAGFLLKIPKQLVVAFPNRIINIHPSLLPKFGGKGMYGKLVHEAVIKSGEKKSGITIHYVNEEYDEGKIILQQSCEISDNETVNTLEKKIHELEYTFLPIAVEEVINSVSLELNKNR